MCKHIEERYQVNYLSSEIESIYHQFSLRYNLSDSESLILYMIYVLDENCLLSDICKKTGMNKQTINSAMRKLEKKGILYLSYYNGKNKRVVLTDIGKCFLNSTVSKLYEAEAKAFDSWSEEEIKMYVKLMKKYVFCLREEVNKL